MNLAYKDIRKNLGRFVMTTIGIGMLLMIVMGMAGIYRGLLEDATFLIHKIGADLWIVQQDTRGPFAELSRVVAYTAGMQLFPKFPRRVVLTNEDLIQLAVVVFIISVLSSLLGIWKALKIEPNNVLMS
jgi:ABC-type antimicrobial peptide transport system permease subunit